MNKNLPSGSFVAAFAAAAMSFSLYGYLKHRNDINQAGVDFAITNLVFFILIVISLVLSLMLVFHQFLREKKRLPINLEKNIPGRLIIQGEKVPLLVFVRDYDPSKFEPIKNKLGSNKPRGGLWTSPFKPDSGSEWIEWTRNEDFNLPKPNDPITFIKVKTDGKFLLIDTLDDLKQILNVFEMKHDLNYHFDPVLDYEKISKQFDGIFLTFKGQQATRLSCIEDPSRASLYGWDCETVFILNANAITVTRPGRIEAKWVDKTEDNIENFT